MIFVPTNALSLTARPVYPQYAVENCIEGDVTVRYKVSENHTAIDIVVIRAEPEGVFEESTIKAMSHYYDEDAPGTIKEQTVTWRFEGKCEVSEADEK